MLTIEKRDLMEFNRLYNEVESIYHQLYLKQKITNSMFNVLHAIVELGDGCLQKDISKKFFSVKQTINSTIKSLQQSKYIELKQGKGRDMHIYLTASGKDFIKEKIQPIIDIENETISQMTDMEMEEFFQIGKKYVEIFDRKAKEIILE